VLSPNKIIWMITPFQFFIFPKDTCNSSSSFSSLVQLFFKSTIKSLYEFKRFNGKSGKKKKRMELDGRRKNNISHWVIPIQSIIGIVKPKTTCLSYNTDMSVPTNHSIPMRTYVVTQNKKEKRRRFLICITLCLL
jgi:hypothetical protein